MGSRYNIRNLLRGIQNPGLIRGELENITEPLTKAYYKSALETSLTDVTERDWDNLIILDACRYDAYNEVLDEDRNVESEVINTTDSPGFMSQHYAGKNLHDTVYVTANPFSHQLDENNFFATNILTETKWNDDLGTVMPEDVVDTANRMYEQYPNKRYIIHFMQPHYPFIGQEGVKINSRGYNPDQSNPDYDAPHAWHILQYNSKGYPDINRNSVWEAYLENLQIVLDHAEELVQTLPGKSVISTDHGTAIGDRVLPVPIRRYGHGGVYAPPVIKIPWDERDGGDRREITSDTPVGIVNESMKNEEDVKQQLRDLGYVV